MTVFDDFERFDSSPKGFDECLYDFYNRVHGPFWRPIRMLLEDWVGAMGPEARSDVEGRLKSRQDHNFASAFWEVYLATAIQLSGYDLESHPKLDKGDARPDWLVSGNGHDTFVEAVVSSAGGVEEPNRALRGQIYDAINQRVSTDFHLAINFEREGTSLPKVKRLAINIQKWLDTLSHNELLDAAMNQQLEPPVCTFTTGDWAITLEAYPVGIEMLKRNRRPLAAFPVLNGSFDEKQDIRRTLFKKATKYKVSDSSFVIALNRQSMLSDLADLESVIFGDGPHRGPVAAIVTADNLLPSDVASKSPTLWKLPEFDGQHLVIPGMSQRTPDDWVEPQVSAADFFGLESGWPGDTSSRFSA